MSPLADRKLTLLLVDDEADFREALGFFFRRKGYEMLFASNGKEAFEVIRSHPVDVVISDILMPGGNGIELLERVRGECQETPIILLVTGFADFASEDAYQKGAEALFSKPFELKELADAVERLMLPSGARWSRASDATGAELEVSLQVAGLTAAIEAKVMSLGRGGMFVALHPGEYPDVNAEVSFKIAFHGAPAKWEGVGIVRWVRIRGTEEFPAGCGIEFTFLGEKEREEILAILSAKKPVAYIPNR